MIDTHCHLTFPDFSSDVDGVLDEACAAGVYGMITIATTADDAMAALTLAEEHPRVWCSAGVHPLYADQGPHDWRQLCAVASSPRCVAWGELGLDNHYKEPASALQHAVLREQLECIRAAHAEGLKGRGSLPVIVHCREAFADLIPVLVESGLDPSRFVFHCFTGTPDDARHVLDFGAWISFTGVVTYPSAPDVREAAALVPEDRIMVETDAPFMAPVPHRGKRPCRPAWVRHTAEAIAAVRGVPFDRFCAQLDDNTERFFGIRADEEAP